MNDVDDIYRVYALRYALMDGTRSRRELFPGLDPSEEGPASIAYYVWLAVNDVRTVLIDAGMSPEDAERNGRPYHFSPKEGLAVLGVDAASIKDLVLTHLHWDHAGTLDDFANARVHVQQSELHWATDADMMHPFLRQEYDHRHIAAFVQRLHDGRGVVHRGESTVVPGITVHPAPGHTPGVQAVRIQTAIGPVVVAGDALHLYEQMERNIPFRIVNSVPSMLKSYGVLHDLAAAAEYILAGHDPLVAERFPAAKPGLEHRIVRCDVPL